jgi:polyferredoxin
MKEDEKMEIDIKQKLLKFNTIRIIIQFLSFILFSAAIFNLSSLPFLLPILWTWGFEPNIVGDAFTALQLTLYEIRFPLLALASFLIVGVLIGKSLCGWVCPFGLVQDLVGFIKRKKMKVSLQSHRSFIYIKYGVLTLALFISVTFSVSKFAGIHRGYENAIGIFAKLPFTAVSPAESLFAALPKMIQSITTSLSDGMDILSYFSNLPALFWVQLILLVGVLMLAAYVPRSWCKYFCPIGAIMAVLNKFSFLGLRRDLIKCAKGECRLCVEACPMQVQILSLPWEKFSDPECIYCLKCVDACPNDAIRLKYP